MTPHRPSIILIADNDIISREMLREVIESCGQTPFTAATADEALSLAQYVPFDIAFCAVCLPPLGGFYAAEALSIKQPRLKSLIHIPLTLFEPDKLLIYTKQNHQFIPVAHPLATLPHAFHTDTLSLPIHNPAPATA